MKIYIKRFYFYGGKRNMMYMDKDILYYMVMFIVEIYITDFDGDIGLWGLGARKLGKIV